MNGLKKFTTAFNTDRPKLIGITPSPTIVYEEKGETVLNPQGERDGFTYRISQATLYEPIQRKD